MTENGKVIVTGCLGAKKDGDQNSDRQECIQRCWLSLARTRRAKCSTTCIVHLPKPHDPYTDLVPPAGIKLTPRHYAYLKISEGCNHRCSFCIIPSMRGDLVSRPIGDVLREAENLLKQGVRELLVISQDTSAYGVDVKYQLGFVGGRAVRTRMAELVNELGRVAQANGAWVRLHYVYPYPHVDAIVPLMAEGQVLPYLDVPFQHAHPRVLKVDETARFGRKEHRAYPRMA